MNRGQKLQALLLKEKIEKLSGKKVVLKEFNSPIRVQFNILITTVLYVEDLTKRPDAYLDEINWEPKVERINKKVSNIFIKQLEKLGLSFRIHDVSTEEQDGHGEGETAIIVDAPVDMKVKLERLIKSFQEEVGDLNHTDVNCYYDFNGENIWLEGVNKKQKDFTLSFPISSPENEFVKTLVGKLSNAGWGPISIREKDGKLIRLVEADSLSKEKKKYIIAFSVVNQYAEGITGQNFYIYIIAGPNKEGFNSKQEAKAAFKLEQKKDRNKFKVTKDDRGIGWYYSKPEIMTPEALAEKRRTAITPYYKYGTPIYLDVVRSESTLKEGETSRLLASGINFPASEICSAYSRGSWKDIEANLSGEMSKKEVQSIITDLKTIYVETIEDGKGLDFDDDKLNNYIESATPIEELKTIAPEFYDKYSMKFKYWALYPVDYNRGTNDINIGFSNNPKFLDSLVGDY